MIRWACACLLGLAALLGLATAPASARADGVSAGERFRAGEAAFARHDYVAAGTEFDAAYADSPHESSLFNAALSWEKAGELARAANLYRRYLRVAPAGAKDRAKAAASVDELSRRLGKLDLIRSGATEVRLDGRLLDEDAAFTSPGEHALAWVALDGKPDARVVRVAAGETVSVVLVAPPATVEPSPKPTPIPAPPKDAAPIVPIEPPRSGVSPWVAIVLGSATFVSGGVLLWSGIDVLQAKADFEQQKPGLDVDAQRALIEDGVSRTDRTNVLVGITSALGVATGITLVFTDYRAWSRSPDRPTTGVHARLGPGWVAVAGAF